MKLYNYLNSQELNNITLRDIYEQRRISTRNILLTNSNQVKLCNCATIHNNITSIFQIIYGTMMRYNKKKHLCYMKIPFP